MANVRIKYTVDKSQVDAAEKSLEELNRTTDISQKEADELNKKYKEANNQLGDTKSKVKDVNKELNSFNSLAAKGGALIAGLFAAQQLVSFAKGVVTVTGEFQKFQAVLTNTLGSGSKAKKALDDITKFASVTPFSVQQLTSSFIKLANQGFVPTTNELRKLGDLSASVGKDFDMLTEALIDAQVGEFERLKEFGIRASKQGDQVKFTFKGVQTQTEFTNEAIRDYILSLGDLQGVSGSMAAISGTVEGKISNLGDNFTQLQKNIGDSNSGLIANILDLANNALSGLNESLQRTAKIEEEVAKQGAALPPLMDRLAFAFGNLFSNKKNEEIENYRKTLQETKRLFDESDTLVAAFNKQIEGMPPEDQIVAIDNALKNAFNNPYYIEFLNGLREQFLDSTPAIQQYVKQWDQLTDAQKANFISQGEASLKIKENARLYEESMAAMKAALNEVPVAAEKDLDEVNKSISDSIELAKKSALDLSAILESIMTEGEQQNEDYYKTAERLNEEFTNHYKEKAKERSKIDDEEGERKKAILMASIDFALSAADSITAISNNRLQKEINDLEKQKQYELNLEGRTEEQKQAIQERFDAQILEARRQQARREKALALFNIAINTSEAVVKAIAASPVTFGLPFSAFALAAGGLQAGVVASQPLPFNKGTKRVPGHNTSRDSVPAILTPGEGVMPVDRMNDYRPAFEAIFDRKIRPEVLNSFVRNGGSQVVVNNDMEPIARAIKGQPQKTVVMDKHGFTGHIITQTQKIKTKESKYSW